MARGGRLQRLRLSRSKVCPAMCSTSSCTKRRGFGACIGSITSTRPWTSRLVCVTIHSKCSTALLFDISIATAFGLQPWALVAYGTVDGLFSFFGHANFKLPARLDHVLRLCMVTPRIPTRCIIRRISRRRTAITARSLLSGTGCSEPIVICGRTALMKSNTACVTFKTIVRPIFGGS